MDECCQISFYLVTGLSFICHASHVSNNHMGCLLLEGVDIFGMAGNDSVSKLSSIVCIVGCCYAVCIAPSYHVHDRVGLFLSTVVLYVTVSFTYLQYVTVVVLG